MENIRSAFLRLDRNDFVRSLAVAFLAPILSLLSSTIGTPGFTFSSLDFSLLFKIGVAAMLAYLVKNYFSSSDGKILGRWG